MVVETTYSAQPFLRAPRRLAAQVRIDLKIIPSTSWKLFVRGLRSGHRQSRLGYLWLLVPAVAATLTWVYLAHRRILLTGHTAAPYALYVLGGTLLFQLFVDALTAPLERLTEAAPVLTKSRLPHECWIVAGALNAMFGLVIRLTLLIAVLLVTGGSLRVSMLLAGVGMIALLLLGLSIGLLVTPLGLLYHDVSKAMIVVVGLGFFLTPVIYPQSHLALVRLNPVTPVLVTTRSWLIGGPVEPLALAIVALGSLLLLAVSWLIYRVAQPHLVERM